MRQLQQRNNYHKQQNEQPNARYQENPQNQGNQQYGQLRQNQQQNNTFNNGQNKPNYPYQEGRGQGPYNTKPYHNINTLE